jgi:hypothetical protein
MLHPRYAWTGIGVAEADGRKMFTVVFLDADLPAPYVAGAVMPAGQSPRSDVDGSTADSTIGIRGTGYSETDRGPAIQASAAIDGLGFSSDTGAIAPTFNARASIVPEGALAPYSAEATAPHQGGGVLRAAPWVPAAGVVETRQSGPAGRVLNSGLLLALAAAALGLLRGYVRLPEGRPA